VVFFIEGNEGKAEEKLLAAAAANSPEQISQFACILRAVNMIPGASGYMEPVLKVIALLENAKKGQATATAVASPGSAEPGQGTTPDGKGGGALVCPLITADTIVTTAATDVAQIRAAAITPAEDPGALDCGRFVQGARGKCVIASKGTVVVTDLISPPDCSVFVASVAPPPDSATPDWQLTSPLRVHGTRLLVSADKALVVGASPTRVGANCAVVWAGFVPYVAASEPSALLSSD
jgi:hypothetical protein